MRSIEAMQRPSLLENSKRYKWLGSREGKGKSVTWQVSVVYIPLDVATNRAFQAFSVKLPAMPVDVYCPWGERACGRKPPNSRILPASDKDFDPARKTGRSHENAQSPPKDRPPKKDSLFCSGGWRTGTREKIVGPRGRPILKKQPGRGGGKRLVRRCVYRGVLGGVGQHHRRRPTGGVTGPYGGGLPADVKAR